MSAPIAAPLVAGDVRADGLTFTGVSPGRGGVKATTDCPAVASKLGGQGWAVSIANRPERAAARSCEHCGSTHR